jgi:hypothetical protein
MMRSTEREILQTEVERLTAEGFDVFIDPGPALTPAFAEGYRPDAVAIGKGRRIALEVASHDDATDRNLGRVAGLFRQHPEWEFQVVWAEPLATEPVLPIQSSDQIRAAIDEVKTLRAERLYRPAFLLAWAAFEAAARAVAGATFARPQSPGRLVEVLAREGHLSPAEADAMRV